MMDCGLCGKASRALVGRWYRYDDGGQTLERVCQKCADLHSKMIEKEGK